MAQNNEKHEEEVTAIWKRVDEVNLKVEGLYEMTAQLKQDRAEAGQLLVKGKERIKECKVYAYVYSTFLGIRSVLCCVVEDHDANKTMSAVTPAITAIEVRRPDLEELLRSSSRSGRRTIAPL